MDIRWLCRWMEMKTIHHLCPCSIEEDQNQAPKWLQDIHDWPNSRSVPLSFWERFCISKLGRVKGNLKDNFVTQPPSDIIKKLKNRLLNLRLYYKTSWRSPLWSFTSWDQEKTQQWEGRNKKKVTVLVVSLWTNQPESLQNFPKFCGYHQAEHFRQECPHSHQN